MCSEKNRLKQAHARKENWQRWGPYLSERQWGTVREDYSADGDSWSYFPFEHSHSRAYRWGEDGLLGFTDRECRLCFSLAVWNGKDPILKERLYGLNGHQGNHGEDVKELYYYQDATPTYSYCKATYRYPLEAFPYDDLQQENKHRGLTSPEYELQDTTILSDNAFADVTVEYAKSCPDDILIRLTAHNHGDQPVTLHFNSFSPVLGMHFTGDDGLALYTLNA